jgi:oxygen-independent coproporphyrinogen-3 oxidase
MRCPFPTPRAAYVHVPFCRHRCGYCNFTLIAGRDDLIDDYLRAIERELAALGEPREVDTLFLGGGTPTQLPPDKLTSLIAKVRHWFPLTAGGEFSVEANPADINGQMLAMLSDQGVTRLSLGGQSFDAQKLQLLERDHAADRLRQAIELSKVALASVSLDLIFGVPGETLDVWMADLAEALSLAPDHLSTYGLTFERGTAFWSRLLEGELGRLDEEFEREMYLAAIDTLSDAGLQHYEVSNFARPGHRCRHNETYWAGDGYFAVGPGAARYVDGRREMNHRSTTTWLKRVLAGESPVAESETLSPEDRAREVLVFGLRRMDGVARGEFAGRSGIEIDALVGPALAALVEQGLLEDRDGRIRLSRAGLLVSDAIWPRLLRAS